MFFQRLSGSGKSIVVYPGGIVAISRGLRSEATIPPEKS